MYVDPGRREAPPASERVRADCDHLSPLLLNGLRDYGVEGQIGLEKTPQLYVDHLVEVFREVRRVLRDDGTCWLNLGDSYVASACGVKRGSVSQASGLHGASSATYRATLEAGHGHAADKTAFGLASKNLIGIPWRAAFALQEDGWYLRADVIWAKGRSFDPEGAGSCMPESVRDRPTRGHEYVFLLTKQEKYFYDYEAVKETSITNDQRKPYGSDGAWAMEKRDKWAAGAGKPQDRDPGKRNLRSVWVINPQPFKGAHFATFPEKLAETCLLAGSPPSCCPRCGAPHVRIIEKGAPLEDQRAACGADVSGEYHGEAQKDYEAAQAQDASATKARILAGMVEHRTVGWRATCACDHGNESAQSVVLDPFCGSGTVGVVCKRHGRFFLGCDLKPEYLQLAKEQIDQC